MSQFGGAPKCPVCEKNVYFAEEVRMVGKAFHKTCLKCNECRKTLDSTSVNDHEGELYCRTCYGKNFGPKGYGFAAGGAGLNSEGGKTEILHRGGGTNNALAAKFGGGGDKCTTCGEAVYHNEKVDCAGKVFHKLCLKCGDCRKLLEKGSVNEHGGQVFCRGCYTKNYGTKGFVAGTSMHTS